VLAWAIHVYTIGNENGDSEILAKEIKRIFTECVCNPQREKASPPKMSIIVPNDLRTYNAAI
jgi:hypothetical protein